MLADRTDVHTTIAGLSRYSHHRSLGTPILTPPYSHGRRYLT